MSGGSTGNVGRTLRAVEPIAPGDAGPAVRDVQGRLRVAGIDVEDVPGRFGVGTTEAVRRFQQTRGLTSDGVVGADTWIALVDAAHALGDRLLYSRRPLLRGDDVLELQRRLSRLGFDPGPVDGIFGADTDHAVRDFQHNCGVEVDGIVGPGTVRGLRALHRDHQHVGAVEVLERLDPPAGGRPLATGRIMIDPVGGPDSPGRSRDGAAEHEIVWDIARRICGQLGALGAHAVLTRSATETPDVPTRAARANDGDADVVVVVRVAHLDHEAAHGAAAYYFGGDGDRSPEGLRLAELTVRALARRLGTPDCRAHPSRTQILREVRAPAIVADVGFLSHDLEGAALLRPDHRHAIADALTGALTQWWSGAVDPRT